MYDNEMESTVIGDRLDKLIKESGIAISTISEKTHINRKQINNHRQSLSVPYAKFIKKYCDFFNVSADWLLGLTDERRNLRQLIEKRNGKCAVSLFILKLKN